MKLAIIDLDMVIADNTERMKRAASRKDWHKANLREALKPELDNPVNAAYVEKSLNDLLETLYWQRAFEPILVDLDVPMAVDEELEVLDRRDFQILFLTSRPESMREATTDWLNDHSLYAWSMVNFPGSLIMKAPAFQYVKTVIWKAGMIHSLAALSDATELLVIDDEDANIQELEKYRASFRSLITAKSLAEAVAKLNGTWVEPDPFLPSP